MQNFVSAPPFCEKYFEKSSIRGHQDIKSKDFRCQVVSDTIAADELKKMEDVEKVRREMEKGQEKPMSQKMFRVI